MSAWQPIETAPKDKGQILGWFPLEGNARQVYVMYWNDDKYAKRPKPMWDSYGWMWGRQALKDAQPTHWMPLPEPPQ